ncbi:MAG: hypothetical protein ACREN2_06120 [Candidatus Dormibacteria bacterium]
MTNTDTDRLLGEGIPITLAGHSFHARFTPRALMGLEQRYGSIVQAGQMLQRLSPGADDPAPLYENVYYLLSLALRHETVPTPGRDTTSPVTLDWLLDNTDTTRVLEYVQAVSAALIQALPAGAQRKDGDPTTPPETAAKAEMNGSTGDDGSGLPSHSSDSLLASSGTT